MAFARRLEQRKSSWPCHGWSSGLVGRDMRDPIGEEIWRRSRLLLPHSDPGTKLPQLLTDEVIVAAEAEQGAALQMGDVFAHLPFALLERVE